MSRRATLFLTFVLAAGQDGNLPPIPDQDLLLRVTAGAREVELGKAFPLMVVRSWSKELVPDDWSDEALAPLVVRVVDTKRREDERRVEETRRYQCWAFRRGEITVSASSFKAKSKSDGTEREASSEELRFVVLSALRPDTPGPAELPSEPFAAPFAWLTWTAGACALAALALLLWYSRRRAQRRGSAPAPPLAPHVRALARLQGLRERQPHGREEIRADSVEAASLVRTYIEERFSVCAPEMTTEEFLTDPGTESALRTSHREMVSVFLVHCDFVKFARHAPTAAERERRLAAVEAFVLETRVEQIPPAAESRTA